MKKSFKFCLILTALISTSVLTGIRSFAYNNEFINEYISDPYDVTLYNGYNTVIDGSFYYTDYYSSQGTPDLGIGLDYKYNVDKFVNWEGGKLQTRQLADWISFNMPKGKTEGSDGWYQYGTHIEKSWNGLNSISNWNGIYAEGGINLDKDQKESDGSVGYAIKLGGVKQEASNRWLILGMYGKDDGNNSGIIEDCSYIFEVKNEIPKIYPDKYENKIILSPDEIKNICPWIDLYERKETKDRNGNITDVNYILSSEKKQQIINQYNGSKYFNKDWVNSTAGMTILTSDITVSYYKGKPYFNNEPKYSQYTMTGEIELEGLFDTMVVSGARSGRVGKGSSWYSTYHGFKYNPSLTSTWQISTNKNSGYQNIAQTSDQYNFRTYSYNKYKYAGSSEVFIYGDRFSFDMYRKEFIFPISYKWNSDSDDFDIQYQYVPMPENMKSSNSFYIRRNSSAVSEFPFYNNAISPAKRLGPALTLDKLTVSWNGPAVTEGTQMDPQYVRIEAKYSDSDTPTIYNGAGNYIKYYYTKIMNVGNNNYVYYIYTDPRTGDVKQDYFVVPGKERIPVSISASYVGGDVVENLEYSLQDLRVTVTFNNGTTSNYPGTSASIGATAEKFFGRGDLDGNTVLNSADLNLLNTAIKDQSTLSSEQRTQADVNQDGAINDSDVSALSKILDRTVPIGGRVFYATYSKLLDANGVSMYAQFRVDGKVKSPYKLLVTQKPLKTTYIEGEDFDPTGMILTIYYNNGEYKIISFDGNEDRYGLTIGDKDNPTENMSTKQTYMPITYTENGETVKARVKINIVERHLTSLKITKAPDTVVYAAGENFKTTGMEVTAYFDEGVKDHEPAAVILSTNDYELSNNKRLNDSTEYFVVKADTIDDSNREMLGYVRIKKNTLTSNNTDLSVGVSGTFTYKKNATKTETVKGTIVGNYLIKVSYTNRGVTKYDYQPIVVNKKKLTGIQIEQMPYKVDYLTGQSFDPSGLILKATYTDGTSEYIYGKTDVRNGYTIIDPNNLQSSRSFVVAEYTEDNITKQVEIPITVTDPAIDSIQAVYVGPNVFVGSEYDPHDVVITINYTDGTATSIRGDAVNTDGTLRAKLVIPETDGSINMAKDPDYKVYLEGENTYAAIYAGKTATFIVIGIDNPNRIDFSGSIAKSKRKYSTWTEDFTAIKIKSVADYINGEVKDLNTDIANQDELHLVEEPKTTDTRTYLTYEEGTGTGVNPGSTTLKSPLLSFLREGNWRQPETIVSIEYKARTHGFLFPETVNAKFSTDDSYLNAYYQNRTDLENIDTDGWSDWVSNSDSTGTVVGRRVAWNYAENNSPDTHTMAIDRLKIRLKDLPAGNSARLNVEVEDTSGRISTYNGITEDITIKDPARIKITLDGNIHIKNNDSKDQELSFNQVYKIYYRATIDDVQEWSEGGEWAGISGTPMQNLEIRLMHQEAAFDVGSSTDAPMISEHPRNITARIGETAAFSVTAVGNSLTYQWYKDGAPISGATRAIYETPELTIADNGSKYYCEVRNGTDRTTKSATVTLTVKDEYPAIITNISDIEENLGSQITLTIDASCRNPQDLKYEWQITNDKGEWTPMAGGGNNSITFTLVQNMHGKSIRCKVSNSQGYVYSYVAKINCKVAPVVDISSLTDYVIASRGTITFTANVTTHAAGGVRSYTWLIDDVLQTSKTEKLTWTPDEVGEHTITVKVKDDYGETVATTTVYVGTAPTVKLTGEQTVNGQEASVKVTAAATSDDMKNLTYEWRVDGELLQNEKGRVITITGLKVGDQKAIMCTVKDNFGKATTALNVSVKQK